jgi:hypothetical protein
MHTLLDFDGNLPACVNITDGKTADNKGAYDIPLRKGGVSNPTQSFCTKPNISFFIL